MIFVSSRGECLHLVCAGERGTNDFLIWNGQQQAVRAVAQRLLLTVINYNLHSTIL